MFQEFLNWLFIHWIHEHAPKSSTALVPNGDDAALLAAHHRGTLVATDMLLDGTHFISSEIDPGLIGRKAVAVNLSDIAAMGGVPESLFISLALPRGMSSDVIQKIMTGAADLAKEFNCGIDGGDTNTWSGRLAINVCVTGRPHWRGAVTRTGAQAGDVVMVSGLKLGGSLASGRHLTFTPRVREAAWLMDHFNLHSMMDLSDGLAADVPRLATASNKQIILDAAKIIPASFSEDCLTSALCDGEDFELLFTCDESSATRIEREFPWPCGVRRIGTVTQGTGVLLRHPDRSTPEPLRVHGYEHK